MGNSDRDRVRERESEGGVQQYNEGMDFLFDVLAIMMTSVVDRSEYIREYG
jgi:hypothetical protein